MPKKLIVKGEDGKDIEIPHDFSDEELPVVKAALDAMMKTGLLAVKQDATSVTLTFKEGQPEEYSGRIDKPESDQVDTNHYTMVKKAEDPIILQDVLLDLKDKFDDSIGLKIKLPASMATTPDEYVAAMKEESIPDPYAPQTKDEEDAFMNLAKKQMADSTKAYAQKIASGVVTTAREGKALREKRAGLTEQLADPDMKAKIAEEFKEEKGFLSAFSFIKKKQPEAKEPTIPKSTTGSIVPDSGNTHESDNPHFKM